MWSAATVFAVLIFPLHIFNYIHISTDVKYFGYTMSLYKFIPILNANTQEGQPMKMMINGKESGLDLRKLSTNYLKLVKKLSFIKIIQLSEFGADSALTCTAAVMQHTATEWLYTLINYADQGVKLRNYTIINQDGKHINYFIKIVNAINILSLASAIFIILRGKKK